MPAPKLNLCVMDACNSIAQMVGSPTQLRVEQARRFAEAIIQQIRDEVAPAPVTILTESAPAELVMLLIEWRDARGEWFDLTGNEVKATKTDRTLVLARLGKAEANLLEYTRALMWKNPVETET